MNKETIGTPTVGLITLEQHEAVISILSKEIDTLQADVERVSKERDEFDEQKNFQRVQATTQKKIILMLEKERDTLKAELDRVRSEWVAPEYLTGEKIISDRLRAQVNQLRAALEFYADKNNYRSNSQVGSGEYFCSTIKVDDFDDVYKESGYRKYPIAGAKAREALASVEKENG